MKVYRIFSPAPIETHPLKPAELPLPEPGPGQVRIKVAMCGVCHTDLHTAEGDIKPPAYPVTPGHQVVGVVEAVGETLSPTPDRIRQNPGGAKVGDRVGVPWLHWADGTCEYCRRGLENLCPNARFTGFQVDGGYAEYMLAEAAYVLPLPEAIGDEQAAPLLCAGIVGYRSLKLADIRPDERVGLFGFGAAAHLSIQVLTHWGCPVHVFTRSAAHQEHARELGAAWAGDAGEGEPGILDRAVIFAPVGELVPVALEKIRPGGTVAVNAIHTTDIPSFRYDLLWSERTLRSVANATYQDGVEFMDLAAQIGIRSTTKLYPLAEANQALEDMKHSRFNGEAVLMVGEH
jgi:propanol-preferring alcohol dehydrogenase